VRDTPLSEFADEDLCKACRQELYPKWVVPHAISRLKVNPFVGERYEGELIVALDSIPNDFWREHPSLASELRSILNDLALRETYENVSDATRRIQERLRG
jgi:hypothetical protein